MTNPSDFVPCIADAVKVLTDHKDEINRLNVFPVPDGDTGTNMSLTLEAVLDELATLPQNMTLADIRKAVTHGSLMGARGNSGVITSQILRGICDGLAEADSFDAKTVSEALDKAVEVAFGAVRKPVEGTILTVLRDVADAARAQADEHEALEDVLLTLTEAAYASVERTPELLLVLKENGVVDAGGYGLALLIDGLVSSVVGVEGTGSAAGLKGAQAGKAALGSAASTGKVVIEQIDDWEGSEYLYCTEFLFTSDDLDVSAAHEFLANRGDCELLVGAHPDFKVHVHTNEPGTVLSYMTQRGQVSEVHIHNMRLQSAERLASLKNPSLAVSASGAALDTARGAADAANASGASAASGVGTGTGASVGAFQEAQPKDYGFVAVASGSGMKKILVSLGVDEVVSGGQTMNPSTKDLLDAAEKVNAQHVFILPNNKNIILAATAAAKVSDKHIEVIPTKSVPQSFSALFVVDQDASFEENAKLMSEAIELVHFAEVTEAIKDAKAANGTAIHSGDIIGILNDSIEVVGDKIALVALELVGLLADEDADTLTILAGEDFAQPDFEKLLHEIEEAYPDLELDAHRGEQPLYPLVMSAE
ncbi:MAG: DAK2 domain-containing protein [Coriobacteriales bacterium]|jgi:DAK2 domain fusion protein YloV|nr:DAK2 domain-containing protein [Coriobacteriales bacterium]